MTTGFRIRALDAERFRPLFDLDDETLRREHSARWIAVDADPSYPCRVSLMDAPLGESVLALPYRHHDVASAYRASGPIFVRRDQATAQPAVNEIPAMFFARPQSVRAYDEHGDMRAAELGGADLAEVMQRLLAVPGVAYLHLHNAWPGCFNCRVDPVR